MFSGVNTLELLLRKGLLSVTPEEDGQEAVDIVHKIANATNQIKYNAASIREAYDMIGTARQALRFFNFTDDGECVEVRKEEYRGEYTPEQEIPY